MNKLDLGIVIPTRNRKHDILRCLESLSKQTVPAHEIIIVDSSDTPLNQDHEFADIFSAETFPHTACIYKHTARGAAYQRNRGIEIAQADILFFFDDDVTLEHTYLEIMRDTFAQHPDYAGGMSAIAQVPAYTNYLAHWFRRLFLLDRNGSSGNFTLSGLPTHTYGNTNFSNVEVLGGCCMAFKAPVVKHYLFDENLRYYSYMEDCDLSYRVSRAYKLFYQPAVSLEHHESPVARDRVRDNRAMYIANYSYLFFKNFYPQARWKIIFFFWSILGLFLEGLLRRNKEVLIGYSKGLAHALRHRGSRPYAPAPARTDSYPTVS